MPKISDTQSIILTRAASRPRNLALPLPKGLAGAAAKMTVGKMIERGWLEEVDANLRRKEPLWRETGDGHGTTLIATEAGFEVIGIDPVVASTIPPRRKVKPELGLEPKEKFETSPNPDGPKPAAIRAGTKQAQIIALLQRPEGASIGEIVEATSWQAHTARGVISGALKKKLGLTITSEKQAGRGTVYRQLWC
ncbi:DUF3489 domain-containing protein [Thalassobacter stenotrophicus]|uniref:DUF3489 domain-containing protein n=1 Tax=Thalassobacter stenotrophicus TaxID=266809 RepID=UPI000D5CA6FD|nr:DUF3489 domain-containing protein [Thalassobacter stenotrophicus]PVZ48700.1 hypothetical protein DD557_08130 [Thalassobacter stenotrophicus]